MDENTLRTCGGHGGCCPPALSRRAWRDPCETQDAKASVDPKTPRRSLTLLHALDGGAATHLAAQLGAQDLARLLVADPRLRFRPHLDQVYHAFFAACNLKRYPELLDAVLREVQLGMAVWPVLLNGFQTQAEAAQLAARSAATGQPCTLPMPRGLPAGRVLEGYVAHSTDGFGVHSDSRGSRRWAVKTVKFPGCPPTVWCSTVYLSQEAWPGVLQVRQAADDEPGQMVRADTLGQLQLVMLGELFVVMLDPSDPSDPGVREGVIDQVMRGLGGWEDIEEDVLGDMFYHLPSYTPVDVAGNADMYQDIHSPWAVQKTLVARAVFEAFSHHFRDAIFMG